MISFIIFLFTLFPFLIHDLWPLNTWIQAFIIIICIVLPFLIPVIRNYASVFLVFYWYIHIVSWRVFKTEFMGAVPYSDELFYPILFGCAITVILFPLIGPLHQSAFNIYYRFVLIFFAQHVQSAMIQSTCGQRLLIIPDNGSSRLCKVLHSMYLHTVYLYTHPQLNKIQSAEILLTILCAFSLLLSSKVRS